MSASFVIFFWLSLAAIYGLFWLLFLVLFISGRRKQSRLLSWISGIPLFISTGFAVLCLGMMGYSFISTSRPANVYNLAFGSPPSADVTNIRSSYYYFADTGITHLKFNASPSTIKKLTAKGWNRLKGQELADARASNDTNPDLDDDTPSWYRPNVTESTIIYTAERRVGDFANESETLTYDTKTQEAYYDFVGID